MEEKKIKYTNHKVKLDYVVKLSMSGSKSKITTVFTITLIRGTMNNNLSLLDSTQFMVLKFLSECGFSCVLSLFSKRLDS